MKSSMPRLAMSLAALITFSISGAYGADAGIEPAPMPPSSPLEMASTLAAPAPPAPPAPPAVPDVPAAPQPVAASAPLGHAMDGCGASCEASCASSGGDCGCCGCHLIATAEAVWLSPCENQREASFTISNNPGINPTPFIEQFSGAHAADDGLIATPRITLGLQGECWGAQIRYWRMQEGNNLNGDDFATGLGAVTSSGFFAETLDLEATRLLCIGDSPAQFTFGARYAQLNQSVSAYANDFIAGEFYSGSARSDMNFSGVGLTSSLWGLKPINCSNFNLFYSVRASILWDGNASGFAETRADYQSPLTGAWAKDYHAAYAAGESNMFIGELQLGGQWNFALKCIPANAFLRCAFEYQYWAVNDTGYAQSISNAGNAFVGTSTAHSGDAFVNLVGFNVGTGITW